MKTKLIRSMALILAIMSVLTGLLIPVGATDSSASTSGGRHNNSVTDSSIEDVRELMNTISYEEYLKQYSDTTAYPKAESAIVIDGTAYDKDGTTAEVKVDKYDGVEALYTPDQGSVTWTVDIPKTAKYAIEIEYYPIIGKPASIERKFKINGVVPFTEAYYITLTKLWKTDYPESSNGFNMTGNRTDDPADGKAWFTTDVDENEIRATISQHPEWMTYSMKDIDGYYSEPFQFVFEAGKNTLTLDSVNEPMAVKAIKLYPLESYTTYEEYKEKYSSVGKGGSYVKIEAEYPYATSSNTIYPVEDRTSGATSPSSTDRTLLNTVGGDKWQTSGQWVEYKLKVEESGMYGIAARFRQNINDGIYSSRVLYIFSEGLAEGANGYYNGIPFAEATELRFNYDEDWQSQYLQYATRVSDGPDKKGVEQYHFEYNDCEFYFEAGVEYTIRLEVALGDMGALIRRVEAALQAINNDYLNIIKLTGTNPDSYADYEFSTVMPETIIDLNVQSTELYSIAADLEVLADGKTENIAILNKVAFLLDRMGKDEDEIAKNLDQLKTYIGTLGTFLSDAKTQPLQLDYIAVQSIDKKLPQATPGFFASLWHEIKSFFASFVRNYDRMGVMAGQVESLEAADTMEAWLATGRDQSQVLRNLINNDFTPNTGLAVNLKLVAGGTLLPSILAGMGPDVYIGLGDDNVVNYAIRGAIEAIENMEGFDELCMNPETSSYHSSAMEILGMYDANGDMHYYGLPETQNFPMMFVRTDILAGLNIEIPKTWDELLESVTVLQQNNMTIAMDKNYQIFLYQTNGTLYADDGMRINLDSNVALDAFETMCNLFTQYGLPYKYSFVNRFRTGEMPIGIASYNGTYNHLIVYATELRGKWQFVPLPGYYERDASGNYITDDEGNRIINNCSVSSVSAIVMINQNEDAEGEAIKQKAWEFMMWHSGYDFQVNYSNEMVAIMGDSAKHATANLTALEAMPWTQAEIDELKLQFNKVAIVPNYPGMYIIGRYTNFAFLAAYNNNADPVTELLSYITTINKEITRKRQEFGLETLEIGQTLAAKRIEEAKTLMSELSDADKATYAALLEAFDKAYADLENDSSNFKTYCETEHIDALQKVADDMKAADETKFAKIYEKLSDCAESLREYQLSYPKYR